MTTTLACKQCGHENESERIYCHNCGAKLDRSVLLLEKKEAEPLEKERKRVRKLTNPNSGFFAGGLLTSFNVVLWSVVTAAVLQAVRPPDGVPPLPKKGELSDSVPLALQLEEAAQERAPRRLEMSDAVINDYLRNAIKSRSEGLIGDTIKFERAYVNTREGAVRITVEQTTFDYPLFMSAEYQLAIANNQIVATSVGGSLGRLPVHPLLMKAMDILFQRLWDSLRREHRLMDGMGAVEVHPGVIAVITKAAPPPR